MLGKKDRQTLGISRPLALVLKHSQRLRRRYHQDELTRIYKSLPFGLYIGFLSDSLLQFEHSFIC